MQFYISSLGCYKNLVDSQAIAASFSKMNIKETQNPSEADFVVVNTCSFIEDAINESIEEILLLRKNKKAKLIVVGCLAERFKNDLTEELKEVDFFVGTGLYDKIYDIAVSSITDSRCSYYKNSCFLKDLKDSLVSSSYESANATTPYIKVSEGCNNRCTFCIIPKLRGKQQSRPIDDIVKQAGSLIDNGVKEIILVGQDLSNYGSDLYKEESFSKLLLQLSSVDKDIWIRNLYMHPSSLSKKAIDVILEKTNILSYFDIPIQHASDKILKKMGRKYSQQDLIKLCEYIKNNSKDASLRTTALLAFPGETFDDFETLLFFIKKIGFDNLGAFTYSDAEDIVSHSLKGHVKKDEAKRRYDILMKAQLEIVQKNNKKHINKVYKALIESEVDENLYGARCFFQAPEVDGIVYVEGRNLSLQSFYDIKINKSFDYDFFGEVVRQN